MPTTIDVLKDLENTSALKALLKTPEGAVFTLIQDLALYSKGPVSAAADAKVSSILSLDHAANWTTTNGIAFSLTPSAACSISFGHTSTVFPVAMSIDSPATTDLVANPIPGYVFVNINLNFDIKGSISASGTFSGVGVAGKVATSTGTTLSFCHPILGSTNTLDAIKDAFSHLVFPLEPGCTGNMEAGSLAKITFDGAFDCKLDVTYGFAGHQFSAPSVSLAAQALQNGVQLIPPSPSVEAAAFGSVTYSHADHFALLAHKTSNAAATVYLIRSAENDWGASVGVKVGLTVTNASATIDETKLTAAFTTVTGNATTAGLLTKATSGSIDTLESALSGKLQSFLKDRSEFAGLSLSLSRQRGHTALFAFTVDLTDPALASRSWDALVKGSIIDALASKGFTLLPGSGVSDSLERASTIKFQFFNFYNTTATAFFVNAYTQFAPDGTIRVFKDIGEYQKNTTKGKSTEYRIHFVATATEDTLQNLSRAEVDLHLEFSETSRSGEGHTLANSFGTIPPNASVNAAHTEMIQYLESKPAGTLHVITIVKPTGYRKLSCTPYVKDQTVQVFPMQDSLNWNAFRNATHTLLGVGYPSDLSFANWIAFSSISNGGPQSTQSPDRRSLGNPQGVPDSFYAPLGDRGTVEEFLEASSGFMNLCEDLTLLSDKTQAVLNQPRLDDLTAFLKKIVTNDVFLPFSIPITGALLTQCTGGGSSASAIVITAKDAGSLTCTMTIA